MSDPLGLRGWYCINGQTHYYKGNRFGAIGNGKCGSALSGAVSDYVTGASDAAAASTFLNSSWGHRVEWVANHRTPIIIGAQVVGAVITLGAAVPEEVAADTTTAVAARSFSSLERVGSGLKSDLFHRATSWVVDDPAAASRAITGADGIARTLYTLPGEVNGVPGTFEWIVDGSGEDPVITHQLFLPGN